VGRIESINSKIKAHDSLLFCKRNQEGKLCIYRKSQTAERYNLDDGAVLINLRSTPYLVFAITHNWKESGYDVDWGIEPILARLKAHDLWNRDLASEVIEREEKNQASRDRAGKNMMEDFARDLYPVFKKGLKDINTSNLKKPEPKRAG
jgi:hypothetical protein